MLPYPLIALQYEVSFDLRPFLPIPFQNLFSSFGTLYERTMRRANLIPIR